MFHDTVKIITSFLGFYIAFVVVVVCLIVCVIFVVGWGIFLLHGKLTTHQDDLDTVGW